MFNVVDECHLRQTGGHADTDGLAGLVGTHDVAILAQSEVLADDNLLRLGEMLRHLVDGLVALTLVLIIYIRCTHRCRIPGFGESRTNDATTIQGIGLDAKESLQHRTCRDADAVAEVAVALATGSIVLADLAEVGGRLAAVHLVHHVGHHQAVALFRASSLEVGQGGMHHLSGSHVVDAPRVGQPVGGGNGLEIEC